jgi:tight adherence protein B
MNILLIYGAIFLASLIFFDSALRLVRSFASSKKHVNYRLKLLESDQDQKLVHESMLRERTLDYGVSEQYISWFRKIFIQSGLKLDIKRAVLYSACYLLISWLILGLFIPFLYLKIFIAFFTLIIFAFAYVFYVRSKRVKNYLRQLPDALDIITRSLAAGHPLPTSISLVGREMADPVGSEFGILSDELTYGTDVNDAMQNMVDRVGADDLKLVAISLAVQRGTGGNLGEILDSLAEVLRQRLIIKAKIRALSAEGRMTSWIMAAFPFFLYFLINALAPTYFDPVWDSGYGNVIVAIGVIIMIVGMAILRKIVNFDF